MKSSSNSKEKIEKEKQKEKSKSINNENKENLIYGKLLDILKNVVNLNLLFY